MKKFGERLKQLRTSRSLTQDELGEIFEPNLSQSTIGSYERGMRQPTFENLIILSEFFNVSVDYLLGISDDFRTINDFKEDNPKELVTFLTENEVLFNGSELTREQKNRMVDILTGLFWENFTKKK